MSNVYTGNIFYKIVRVNFTFKKGVNIDTNKFNLLGSCSGG